MKSKFLLSFLLMSSSFTGFCVTWTIADDGNTFNPSAVTIKSGDDVNFTLSPAHDVVEVSQATWTANGSTALSGGFQTAFGGGAVLPAKLSVGTHYYVCSAHASEGMKGTIIVQASTGIPENDLHVNISIYPNPSNGKFQLAFGSLYLAKKYNLEIYDLHGAKMYEDSNISDQITNEIDISSFPKGIYFVKIHDGIAIYDRKIVVQ